MSKFSKINYSKKILATFLLASFVIVLAHIILKYISVEIYKEASGFFYELSARFDLNDENSVPQWLTQFMFLSISVSALLASVLDKDKSKKIIWNAITVVALIFAIDDVSTLHEFTLQTLHNLTYTDTAPTFLRNAWLFLLPFVLLALIWMFVRMIKLFPRRTTFIMTLGGVVFVAGAVLVDSLINNVAGRSFVGQGLLGSLEGGLQLIGMSIFLYGINDYLESHYSNGIKASINELTR